MSSEERPKKTSSTTDGTEPHSGSNHVDRMRRQVERWQAEIRRLEEDAGSDTAGQRLLRERKLDRLRHQVEIARKRIARLTGTKPSDQKAPGNAGPRELWSDLAGALRASLKPSGRRRRDE